MRPPLVQQGLLKVLSSKDKLPESMFDDEKKELEMKVHSAIQLCLADDVLPEVADEDIDVSLWLKLESLHMTKSLTNKLYLKQRLFTFRMKEGTSIKEHLDELNKILIDLKILMLEYMKKIKLSSYYAHYLLPLKILLIVCFMVEIHSL